MATTQYPSGQQLWRKSLKKRLKPLLRFWQKISNDWVFNLSGMLAYNILTTMFPILLALLAISGFILNTISPGSEEQLVRAVANAFPGGSSGTGGVVVEATLNNLRRQAGVLFIIGLLASIFTGSRLFIALENCFSVIFRLRGRSLIRQNLVAIGMLLLYMALAPILFLASIVPTAILNAIQKSDAGSAVNGLLFHIVGLIVAFVVALVLFSVIYIVVPDRPVRFREVWRGTLLAAGLLVLYEIVFPIYESVALRPDNYGSVAAFAIVILIFFYYLALILLLGAEVNSWASGQRESASDIAAILHDAQARNPTRGATGSTADEPRKDKRRHQGARTIATPKHAEPGDAASGEASPTPNGDTHTAPYSYAPVAPQPHRTMPLATRHKARPDADVRRQRTQRALGIALAAGVAAAAFWLQRRDNAARYR